MRKASILFVGVLLGGALTWLANPSHMPRSGAAIAASPDTYRNLNLFGDVFEKVRSDYVEEPEDSKLVESAIQGMLSALDPHSSYLSPDSFRDMQVQTRGEFGGLGIEVTMEDGYVKVVAPIDETPAADAGILANDVITHLDGATVQGLTLSEAVERMRGPVKTPITLTVRREGAEQPLTFTITRDVIRIRSVRHRAEDDIGYIRVTSFNEHTFDGVRNSISALRDEIAADDLRGYVLDLRNNPGGLLDQAIAVSDAFLERGEIVATRGRDADGAQRYNARSGDLSNGKPVVILINGGSASASEIVAGALQDHRRATVIGTRSFGKGSVQTIIPLGSNGALRLTTARYYTPSGRSIQAKGIDPDIMIEQEIPDELAALAAEPTGEAALRGHLSGDDGEERTSSPAYVPRDPEEDVQLRYALDLLRGIQVNSAFPPDPNRAAN